MNWTTISHHALHNPLSRWLVLFAAAGLLVTVFRSFFRARKIQPNGFSWKTLRNELFFSIVNLALATTVLGVISGFLHQHGYIQTNREPARWWVIALEYALFFFFYDAYFYWFHRTMHHPKIYPWVHKIHHFSTSPNLLTNLSLNPLETVINGVGLPLLTVLYTFHDASMAFIAPTQVLMGFYVHSGYEFLPRWWNKTWATKWFITTTFHDQHHKYFNWNFGAFTTLWDVVCGTVRPKYWSDFDQLKARLKSAPAPAHVSIAAAE
jgi:sterol desaturase/sphingolipid hydroxylase (fatty acid hydroxylase superfamily)